jgi:hypothetical protein
LQEKSPKGRTLERRQRTPPECNSEIRGQNLNKQLYLRKVGTSSRIFRKIVMLEVIKLAVEFFIGLQKMSDWTLWRDWTPPK